MKMIDADAIRYEPMLSARGNGQYVDVMVAYKDQIDDLPTIEERKKGKWIHDNTLKQFFCSECGDPSLTDDDRYFYSMDFPNYCPNCGARLVQEGDEHDKG